MRGRRAGRSPCPQPCRLSPHPLRQPPGHPRPFDFQGVPVRVMDLKDGPWFVLTDVCRVLEMGNPSQAASRLDDDEKGIILNDTLGGPQGTIIVNESGRYSLILTSRKPKRSRGRYRGGLPFLRIEAERCVSDRSTSDPVRVRPECVNANSDHPPGPKCHDGGASGREGVATEAPMPQPAGTGVAGNWRAQSPDISGETSTRSTRAAAAITGKTLTRARRTRIKRLLRWASEKSVYSSSSTIPKATSSWTMASTRLKAGKVNANRRKASARSNIKLSPKVVSSESLLGAQYIA
jgi:hypothetical protein